MKEAKKKIKLDIEDIDEIKVTTLDEFREYIHQNYEIPFRMSSEEFWKHWKEGNIEDTFWTTRWASDIVTLRKLENGDYEEEVKEREEAKRRLFKLIDKAREWNKNVEPKEIEAIVAEAVAAAKAEELKELRKS
jgi:chromatin segregation and condensation protein Rec8/ScpA/Scc1 (kleisin family)